jgi:hypothetical protein
MKITSFALMLPLLFVVPACGGEAGAAPAAMAEAAKKFAPLLTQVTGSFGDLTKAFAGITDGASADKAKGAIETATKALAGPMDMIKGLKLDAATLAPLDGLKKTAMDQVGKLMGNTDIVGKIGPALTSLKDLLGK